MYTSPCIGQIIILVYHTKDYEHSLSSLNINVNKDFHESDTILTSHQWAFCITQNY